MSIQLVESWLRGHEVPDQFVRALVSDLQTTRPHVPQISLDLLEFDLSLPFLDIPDVRKVVETVNGLAPIPTFHVKQEYPIF